jgi:tetratricopeptide (TPR) repeat protein
VRRQPGAEGRRRRRLRQGAPRPAGPGRLDPLPGGERVLRGPPAGQGDGARQAGVAPAVVGADAELLIGDLLRARGDWITTAGHYQKYLADRPDGIRLAEARYRLGEALERTGKREDAFALYRKVTVASPLTRWAADASARIDAILSRKKADERAALAQLSAAELIERGMEYFDSMRNQESEADFEAALAAPGLDGEMRCVAAFHRAQSIFKQRDRTRAAPLFDEATTICETTKNRDLLVKSSYQAGRSYANIGRHDLALARYQRAEKDAGAEHSYGDDARLRQAEEQLDLGNQEAVSELLSTLPTDYPKGDVKGGSHLAAGLARLQGRPLPAGDRLAEEADRPGPDRRQLLRRGPGAVLDRAILRPPEEAEGGPGGLHRDRAALPGVLLRAPGAQPAAREISRGVRLAGGGDQGAARRLGCEPAVVQVPPARPLRQPGFARAIEFLRLGLGDQAEAELRRLGMSPPPGKSRIDDPDLIDKIWAMAFLYHGAGRYGHALWVTRWHVLDYRRQWPVGANRARWEIAYPKGWWQLLDRHARCRVIRPSSHLVRARGERLQPAARVVGQRHRADPDDRADRQAVRQGDRDRGQPGRAARTRRRT